MSDGMQAMLPFDDGSTGRVIQCVYHEVQWWFSYDIICEVYWDRAEQAWVLEQIYD